MMSKNHWQKKAVISRNIIRKLVRSRKRNALSILDTTTIRKLQLLQSKLRTQQAQKLWDGIFLTPKEQQHHL